MNKSIFKILEKEKNSKTFNDEESDFFYKNKNILKCDPAFSKYLLVENDFDIIKANIMIRGLKNKEDIDTFIVEGFKNNIPNLSEILKERCLDYPCIKYDDYKVYFPFFNRITNGVYSNELIKLKDNPYSDLFLNYKAFLVDPFDTYGIDLFDSSFTKLVKVSEDLTTVSFFSYHLNCIFVINRQGGIDTMIYLFDKHLKHPNKSHVIDRVKVVLESYYTNQMRDFVSSLYKNEFISYKVFKKNMQSKENLTFIIEFLGCKVNSYEAECVGNLLMEKGYTKFDEKKNKYPGVIVINTCSVTQTSEAKDRKTIKQYRKKYKKSILIVMGCYTQREYELVAYDLNADIVLGTSKRSLIPEYIEEFKKNGEKIVIHEDNNSIKKYEGLSLTDSLLTTRAYLKIQDGCDNYCTYCLIPYIRGRSRSRDKDEILDEVKRLISLGYKEIVLTGIDMGSYGKDFKNGYTFSDLIYEILSKNKDLYRLRISSLEDSQIDDKFLKCLKEFPNLANHLHIPLQSGSETILKRMNRKYDLASFKDKVKKIRKIRSDIALTTDVIVGFPGESEEEFNETFEFCKEINFSKIHVFPYSRREGTIADRLPDQVEEIDKKMRVSKLIALSDVMQNEYNKKFDNKKMEFLVENFDQSKKAYRAHSSNYIEYYISSDKNIEGEIVECIYSNSAHIDFDNVKKIFSR